MIIQFCTFHMYISFLQNVTNSWKYLLYNSSEELAKKPLKERIASIGQFLFISLFCHKSYRHTEPILGFSSVLVMSGKGEHTFSEEEGDVLGRQWIFLTVSCKRPELWKLVQWWLQSLGNDLAPLELLELTETVRWHNCLHLPTPFEKVHPPRRYWGPDRDCFSLSTWCSSCMRICPRRAVPRCCPDTWTNLGAFSNCTLIWNDSK